MSNGSNARPFNLQKEAALNYRDQLNDYLWNLVQTGRIDKTTALKLATMDESTPETAGAKQHAIEEYLRQSKKMPGATDPGDFKQVNELANNWRFNLMRQDRMVYYDAGANDNYKIVIPGLKLTSLPPQEMELVRNTLGDAVKDSIEGTRLWASREVYNAFRRVSQHFIPFRNREEFGGQVANEPITFPPLEKVMATVTDSQGRIFYIAPDGEYKLQGDTSNKEYTLEEIEQNGKVKRNNLYDTLKDQKTEVPFPGKLPKTDKFVQATMEQHYVRNKAMGQAYVLKLVFNRHDDIFNAQDPGDSIYEYLRRFPSNYCYVMPTGIVYVYTKPVVSKKDDPNSPNFTDKSFELIAGLVTWLEARKYDTSQIRKVMQQYAPPGKEMALDRAERLTKNRAGKRTIETDEIAQSNDANSREMMNLVIRNEGLTEFRPSQRPEDKYKLIDAMGAKIRDKYPHGFNNDVFPEEMKKKQAEAIAIGITRDSVVMADSPGSGKTFMSAATADYHAKMIDKKNGRMNQVLIISPSGLIPQNWTTQLEKIDLKGQPADPNQHVVIGGQAYKQKPSALRSFIDPTMPIETTLGAEGEPKVSERDVQVITRWDVPIDPNKRWVVLPYNLFQHAGTIQDQQLSIENAKAELARRANDPRRAEFAAELSKRTAQMVTVKKRLKQIDTLVKDIQRNNFCAVMLDESQMLKHNYSSRTGYILNAIKKIRKRIAMTGTPADNNAADLYGQMELIEHPILHRVDPGTGATIKMDRKQFAHQFFGGFGAAKKLDPQQFRDNISQYTPNMIMLLDLLADFFVRREKEDINPTLPFKHQHKDPVNEVNWKGQTRQADESLYQEIKEEAINDAAIRKARKTRDRAVQMAIDGKLPGEFEAPEEDLSEFDMDDLDNESDEDSLADFPATEEMVDSQGNPLSMEEVKAAIAVLNDPKSTAELQEAVLNKFARLKAHDTAMAAISLAYEDDLKTRRKVVVPPKPGEDVFVIDPNTQSPSLQGKLTRIFADVQRNPDNILRSERKLFAEVQTSDGQKHVVDKAQVHPANPQYQARKIFVVTKFPSVADQIANGIRSLSPNPASVGVIKGTDSDLQKRLHTTEEFKKPDSDMCFLISTMKLGAVGYNFQVSDTALFNDQSWNPSENEQASDRVYRITSPRDVNVIYRMLPVGEDALMADLVIAKEESNREIQSALKLTSDLKRKFARDPQAYKSEMAKVATQFLLTLAQSIHRHDQAKKRFRPQPTQEPEFDPVEASDSWWRRTKVASIALYRHLW